MFKFEKLHKNNKDLFTTQRQNNILKQKGFSTAYKFVHYSIFA